MANLVKESRISSFIRGLSNLSCFSIFSFNYHCVFEVDFLIVAMLADEKLYIKIEKGKID